jgi:hypothetical protein
MRRAIVLATFILLAMAFTASLGWLLSNPDWEPAITAITLLTAITGLFIDRWLSEREHRAQLLVALVHELYMNAGVLKQLDEIIEQAASTTVIMMPRFYNSTLSSVIGSGTFATSRDARLWKLMHAWLQRSSEANERFSFTESYLGSHPKSASDFCVKMRDGNVMRLVRETLLALSVHLVEHYRKESGVGSDTAIFDTEP